MGNPTEHRLGNWLIALSLLILIAVFYPFIKLSIFPNIFFQSGEINKKTVQFSISVPKIGAFAQIIPNINPWNPKEYKEALEKGVAHAKGTSLPGENKTSFLFAHSSTDLWKLTDYNTPFFRLRELNNGDEIIVQKDEQELHYIVFDKKEIWPNDTKYLKEDQGNVLILQTCTPIGTDIKRLLIFAKPA